MPMLLKNPIKGAKIDKNEKFFSKDAKSWFFKF